MNSFKTSPSFFIAFLFLFITACSGGAGKGASTEPSYTIGGTVSGLAGSGLVLQNNGGDNLSISADGGFIFSNFLADGGNYAVTILTQPSNPNQTCTVNNASGTVSGANVTNITVNCVNTYTIGGTITGLTGNGLVLQNNGSDDLPISADGGFTFAAEVADGSNYAVTVLTQPSSPAQRCTATNAEGTVSGANVSHITINCVNVYTIGGTVSGLEGANLVLQNNGGDDRTVNANGSFTFATPIEDGTSYSVSILTQPSLPSQQCSLSNNTGIVTSNHVTAINVICDPSWKWLHPSPRTNTLNDVTWGLSQWVAVGDAGTIITSANGIDWTDNSFGVDSTLSAIELMTDQLIAVGENGTVLTSSNGSEWIVRSTGTTHLLNDLAWSGTLLVAVGDGGAILTSSDSITWEEKSSGLSENLNGVSWTSHGFIAVGDNGSILTSTNGQTWAVQTSGTGYALQAVTASDTIVVTVGDFGSRLTSEDGINWVVHGGGLGSPNLTDVTWNGSKFVLAGWAGTISTSTDGVSWTTQSSGTDKMLLALSGNNDNVVAVGSYGTVLTSSDTVIWSVSLPPPHISDLYGIAESATSYVAVGKWTILCSDVSSLYFTECDMTSTGYSYTLYGATWAGNQFVAVGGGGAILTSESGIYWNVENSGTSNDIYDITWTGASLVAVGQNGTILTSPDGIIWTSQGAISATLRGITWTGTQLVAVGVEPSGADQVVGSVFTSPNGVTWTAQTSGVNEQLESVAGTDSLIVAVGTNGTVLTSPDGLTWTNRDTGSLTRLIDVNWTATRLVAAGDGGVILTSTDGIEWRSEHSGTTNPIQGVASTANPAVVVSVAGTILKQ